MKSFLKLFLCVWFVSLSAFAQPPCPVPPMDDNFNMGCCLPPLPNLPAPGPVTMTANYGVITGCAATYTATCQITFGAPLWLLCDAAYIPVTVSGLPNVANFATFVFAKYVRTWEETESSGLPVNVYRLLINGDFFFSGNTACLPGTCTPPVCAAPYGLPAHMVGHIDYTCDTTNSAGMIAAFSLTHLPGVIQHGPFSTNSIPALSTGTTSYHLVGPAPFSFAPTPVPQGALTGDSARHSTLFVQPFNYFCHNETDVFLGGSLITANVNCLGTASGTPRYHHQFFTANYQCNLPVSFQSIPIPGTPIAATGMLGLNLGQYNSGGVFPGQRSLVVNFGVVWNQNFSCSPVLFPIQVLTGVTTTSTIPGRPFGGIPGTPPPPPATTFADFQNCLPLSLWPSGGGLPVPGYGGLSLPDLVMSVNLP
jgi:hypothetical protein